MLLAPLVCIAGIAFLVLLYVIIERLGELLPAPIVAILAILLIPFLVKKFIDIINYLYNRF